MIIDLGCGNMKRGDIGIDISPLSQADIICNLGFEPIPLLDECADKVVTYHLVEHLPQYVYYSDGTQWHSHT
ncbi:MAG TPA: class I SAM-dependent methyltransferase [Spirochaetia bacterium]|nr:class I SAM-dependent methyltransferase [Spirochaetia bacterium]